VTSLRRTWKDDLDVREPGFADTIFASAAPLIEAAHA
jgi:hypothetical protein